MPSHEPSDALPSPRAGGPGARRRRCSSSGSPPPTSGRRVTVRHRYDATTLTDVVGPPARVGRRPSPRCASSAATAPSPSCPLGDVVAAKVVPERRRGGEAPGDARGTRSGTGHAEAADDTPGS